MSPRSRATAKRAGADMEIKQEAYWRRALNNRHIHRGKAQGIKDKGDLLSVELHDSLRQYIGDLTVEIKNTSTISLGTWMGEATSERLNNTTTGSTGLDIPSPAAIVVHKRHGTADPAKQWVTTTVEELIAIINGNRDHIEEPRQEDTP